MAVRASRRMVTVLFCDVVDSTPLAERLDAETFRGVQNAYFQAVRDVLEGHGGTVEKFIGDAVMAVFGLPRLHEDDAVRALRAASELESAVAPIDEGLTLDHELRLRLRVGVATGEIVAGDPAAGQAFATGEAVVVAERLERAALPGDTLVDDPTYRLAAGAAIVESIEPVPVKGKTGAVTAWRLVGVRLGAPGMARRLDTPLVGRREELARLRAAYDAAVADRRCCFVAVLGAAGVGKSRLVLELQHGLSDEATVLVGRCLPYGEGITFWPVAQILPDETFDGTTDEIFKRVRGHIETLARKRPLVVCFEDVHWGEPTFLSLLEYLAGWISDAPVLLLCLSRPELLDHPLLGAETMTLEPLAAEEADALLELLGAPADARARIAVAAEGNPLFVEQMAALAAEGGGLEVPGSIRALLGARLDRLDADERDAIERAAVVGREFTLGAVAALSDGDVTGPLLSLARKELLRPAAIDDGFRFRHALIRDAAYEAMPKILRAQLHERHGRWLADHDGPDVVVGYHLEQAFLIRAELGPPADSALAREAGERLADGGDRAYLRNDIPAAIALLGRASALLPPEFERRAALLQRLGAALIKAGRFDEAADTLDRAIAIARASGDERSELRALVERQQLRSFVEPAGAIDEIARVAAQVIPRLEAIGDDAGLAKAWRLLSDAHVFACRWRARAEALERALSYARRADEAAPEASVYIGMLAQALHLGPTSVEEGISRCESFLADAQDDLALRASVEVSLASLLAAQGRFDEARAAYASSVEIHERLGLVVRRAVGALFGAEIEVLAGDPGAAARELLAAYETLEALGESGARAVVAAYLADTLLDLESDDEAARFCAIAAEISEPGDVAAQTLHRLAAARLLARRGELDSAEAAARDAASLTARTDSPSLQARAASTLSEILRAQGHRAEAEQLVSRARRLYALKGAVAALDRLTPGVGRPTVTP